MAYGIIAAAGTGERLGVGTPKPEVELLGRPLLEHALMAFGESRCIEAIALVVPKELLESWKERSRTHAEWGAKVRWVVAGGATRQESVSKALGCMPEVAGIVVVHDGARPAVTSRMVEEACRVPSGAVGHIAAVPVTDTVKDIEAGEVVRTLDRSRLMAVQTPQAFDLDALRRAHLVAREKGFEGTDDSSLVERIGGNIRVFAGSRENIKVTYPEDLERAGRILRRRDTA